MFTPTGPWQSGSDLTWSSWIDPYWKKTKKGRWLKTQARFNSREDGSWQVLGFLLPFLFAVLTFSLFNTEECKLTALDILYWGKALCLGHLCCCWIHRSFWPIIRKSCHWTDSTRICFYTNSNMPAFSVSVCRLQSGMNLQICFVNDSGSDKDSDADDSKTETSLDTPLSPMVW